MPSKILTALTSVVVAVSLPALSASVVPGLIELSDLERAAIAELIRKSGRPCPFASSLYADGQRIYCADKPEEKAGSKDNIIEYAIGIDRSARVTFRPAKPSSR